MSRTVLFFAHPNFAQSRLNKALIESAKHAKGVLIKDLYKSYGDVKFNDHIDIKEDQKLIEGAENIVLQFPFHWYSVPALMKQWIDDVLSYGWAFGTESPKTQGKKLYVAITTGGRRQDYTPSGYNNYFTTEFLTPFIQTAKLCKMEFAGHFLMQGARVITDAEIAEKGKEYIAFLEQ